MGIWQGWNLASVGSGSDWQRKSCGNNLLEKQMDRVRLPSDGHPCQYQIGMARVAAHAHGPDKGAHPLHAFDDDAAAGIPFIGHDDVDSGAMFGFADMEMTGDHDGSGDDRSRPTQGTCELSSRPRVAAANRRGRGGSLAADSTPPITVWITQGLLLRHRLAFLEPGFVVGDAADGIAAAGAEVVDDAVGSLGQGHVAGRPLDLADVRPSLAVIE